ncbi:MarR family winged helix-turn-helix transcriptional regulator [Microbacterium neungamense]|uniref:MarR family winged helix-turn-helix transcriptional regulator n=1 Tax=Microbacterium neungamense TaxID=2810535 RepID=UPI00217CCD98|nr:MarR family transcriptional regulator [Microbacterium neungamense]UWF77135.1 MarR family transcriptional regulator [Microbacterium neungamense]
MTDGRLDPEREEALHALEDEFSALFARVRRMYLEYAARLAPGLSPAAYKLFSAIAAAGQARPSELSERMMADKSQVSRMVRELEGHGLIERMPDPADGRSSLLRPTEDGLRRLTAVREGDEQRLRNSLRSWSLDDIRNLARLLHALSSGETP